MWLCDYPTSFPLYDGKNNLSMPNMHLNMMDTHEQSMLQQSVTSPVNLISTGACAQLNVGGGSFICLHTASFLNCFFFFLGN